MTDQPLINPQVQNQDQNQIYINPPLQNNTISDQSYNSTDLIDKPQHPVSQPTQQANYPPQNLIAPMLFLFNKVYQLIIILLKFKTLIMHLYMFSQLSQYIKLNIKIIQIFQRFLIKVFTRLMKIHFIFPLDVVLKFFHLYFLLLE